MRYVFKPLLLLVLVLIMCGSLSSCALVEWITVDCHGDISYVDLANSEHEGLLYQDNIYVPADYWFFFETKETDIELGWFYNLPFSGQCGLYSYTSDAPLFIWTSRYVGDIAISIYIKEDYDYLSQTYILDGTDISFILSDMISKADEELGPADSSSSSEISLYIADAPRLLISKKVYVTNDVYYFVVDGQDWILTEEFVSILRDNNLLP